jgi:hypothetical protein
MEPEDPEITLERMKDTAREAANDLIPVLMEKAINGKTRDALNIFEALADRAGFNRPTAPPPQTLNQFNLNFSPQDMQNMLSGLKTITQKSPSDSSFVEGENKQIGETDVSQAD